ncbi:MAG: hypothetical protein IPK80_02695 [Nannocystis sp.]|nr:hypothetical protein [Nannocystis sp.]
MKPTHPPRSEAIFFGALPFNIVRAVDGTAGTTTAEVAVGVAPNKSKLVKAYYLPGSALTANDTDYATITVSRYTAAGDSKTTIATVTTKITGGTGDWTAKVPVAITLSADNAVAAGALITYEVAKAGSGVALPAGSLVLVLSDAR